MYERLNAWLTKCLTDWLDLPTEWMMINEIMNEWSKIWAGHHFASVALQSHRIYTNSQSACGIYLLHLQPISVQDLPLDLQPISLQDLPSHLQPISVHDLPLQLQPISLDLCRNDFMMNVTDKSKMSPAGIPPSSCLELKQVEFNTIAAGLAGLVGAATRLHRYCVTVFVSMCWLGSWLPS